jgi:predicted metal-dependent hydrolase
MKELFRIERTRNRHSRAVVRDEQIVIRLARNLSTAEERKHIENLMKRMIAMVRRERERPCIDPFRPLLNGDTSLAVPLVTGQTCRFSLMPGSRTAARRQQGDWVVTVGPNTQRKALHRFLWRLLATSAQEQMHMLVHALNAASLNAPLRKVRLRIMSTQWGSCSFRGDISLNAALLLLPYPLLEYVILHELTHRRVRNHSPAFWNTLVQICPGALERRKQLRHYRISSPKS